MRESDFFMGPHCEMEKNSNENIEKLFWLGQITDKIVNNDSIKNSFKVPKNWLQSSLMRF